MEVHFKMQESFTIRAKKAVRKIAAIGTGLGMVGATMMSAVALDYTLGDYPKPFIMNKKFSNVAAIIGETSSPDDNTALLDVLSGLEQATAVSKPGSSGPASGGAQKTEDLQVGKALNNTADGFGTSIDSTDVDGFQDTSVRIDIDDVSDDYQVKDGIRFGNACANQASLLANSGFESPILQTALSFDRDEDWQDKVFITFSKQSVCYRDTFKDGEEYIGEDQDNPVWVWQLSNLGGSSPVIGVKLDLSLDSPDETDNPAYQNPLYETE